jgi:hypothetical protein
VIGVEELVDERLELAYELQPLFYVFPPPLAYVELHHLYPKGLPYLLI